MFPRRSSGGPIERKWWEKKICHKLCKKEHRAKWCNVSRVATVCFFLLCTPTQKWGHTTNWPSAAAQRSKLPKRHCSCVRDCLWISKWNGIKVTSAHLIPETWRFLSDWGKQEIIKFFRRVLGELHQSWANFAPSEAQGPPAELAPVSSLVWNWDQKFNWVNRKEEAGVAFVQSRPGRAS